MNSNLETLFVDLMNLCSTNDAFYFVDNEMNGVKYRVFTYRMASYTDFQFRNAAECRGHTFRYDNGVWNLASLPMQKFFNYAEHLGWGTEIDLNRVDAITTKLDGSLISTVVDDKGEWFVKSKTSFSSMQALRAKEFLVKNKELSDSIDRAVNDGYTVNCEWISPDNQIVIGYPESKLVVLNARRIQTGEYMSRNSLLDYFDDENLVITHDIPSNMGHFMVDSLGMKGIEGFVISFDDGLWVKHKTDTYCALHHLKDSICSQVKLWACCVNEQSDDLRALFVDDQLTVSRIIDMEERASRAYNAIHKAIHSFYENNKNLIRKDYAIKSQKEFADSNVFPLTMKLYTNGAADIKGFLIKNAKDYVTEGDSDDE